MLWLTAGIHPGTHCLWSQFCGGAMRNLCASNWDPRQSSSLRTPLPSQRVAASLARGPSPARILCSRSREQRRWTGDCRRFRRPGHVQQTGVRSRIVTRTHPNILAERPATSGNQSAGPNFHCPDRGEPLFRSDCAHLQDRGPAWVRVPKQELYGLPCLG